MLKSYIYNIETSSGSLCDFDDRLWNVMIDAVIIHPDGLLIYKFKDGTEVTINIFIKI